MQVGDEHINLHDEFYIQCLQEVSTILHIKKHFS